MNQLFYNKLVENQRFRTTGSSLLRARIFLIDSLACGWNTLVFVKNFLTSSRSDVCL